MGRDLNAAERQRLGLRPGEGVLLADVNGAAAEAGLRPNDVVLAVGRESVASAADLNRALSGVGKGDAVMLLVRRGAGQQYVTVTVD